ncbi:MAG TPA: hypothetical protein VFE36_01295 [Candidatus Baltobacteraceae bacterium]|nr:hypothetical protein [Candidatus Baltobacteraceae bacterium]
MLFSTQRCALFLAAAIAFASCAPSGSGSNVGALTPNGPATVRSNGGMAPVVYVANEAGKPNGGTVTVYTQTGKWLRTMHKGIKAPTAFAFDTAHNVYVLNAPTAGGGSVAVYARGGKKFLGHIAAKAMKKPVGLVLDSKNNIYVLNAASPSTGRGNVLVFKAGSTQLIATIVKGISQPTDIASDCHGNVYVLNSKTVTAYGPKHKLNLTIRGMSAATGLMVTCAGTVYVAQSLVPPAMSAHISHSATPTPSSSPTTAPPTGLVTEYAAGSTTEMLTIQLSQTIPCGMAPNSDASMIWVMGCPAFTSTSTTMSMTAYMAGSGTPATTIDIGTTFDMFAFYRNPNVILQTTLAIPRVAPTSGALAPHSGSSYAMQLAVYTIGYASGSISAYTIDAVDESTLGVPVAIASN